MWHKTYRHCSHAWLEDVCKLLRHNSYCKWAIEATMVWRTPARTKCPKYLVLLLFRVVSKLTAPVM